MKNLASRNLSSLLHRRREQRFPLCSRDFRQGNTHLASLPSGCCAALASVRSPSATATATTTAMDDAGGGGRTSMEETEVDIVPDVRGPTLSRNDGRERKSIRVTETGSIHSPVPLAGRRSVPTLLVSPSPSATTATTRPAPFKHDQRIDAASCRSSHFLARILVRTPALLECKPVSELSRARNKTTHSFGANTTPFSPQAQSYAPSTTHSGRGASNRPYFGERTGFLAQNKMTHLV